MVENKNESVSIAEDILREAAPVAEILPPRQMTAEEEREHQEELRRRRQYHTHRHHHSSSGSSHHHSRRRRRRHHSSGSESRKLKSLKKLFKKNKKQIVGITMTVVICLGSICAGAMWDNYLHQKKASEDPSVGITQGQLQIAVSVYDTPVSIVNSAVTAHLEAAAGSDVHEIYTRYNGNQVRLDAPAAVTLRYDILGAPAGYKVEKAVFTVVEDPAHDAGRQYVPATGKTIVDVTNLKADTRYAYWVTVTFNNGVETAVHGAFTTASGPRLLTVEGVYNLRDIGGYTTLDGKRVKQGLLYRGTELDGAVESRYAITEAGKQTMLNDLQIRTEMDLRQPDVNPDGTDMLGAGVTHTYYGAPMYAAIFNEGNGETVRKIFADLAKPANYPVYLHCTYGQDRTGTVCYLLGALLGVDQETLVKEYELSALHHGYVSAEEMNTFVQRLNEMTGATLRNKAENYLISIGVTEAEIDSIRQIFLENVE